MMRMTRFVLFGLSIVLVSGLAGLAAERPEPAGTGERFLLKGATSLLVSVETGWKRDGAVPVLLDIEGVTVTLEMDEAGRVFESGRIGETAGRSESRAAGLFQLDMESGRLRTPDRTLSGMVFEKSDLRMRIRFSGVSVVFELDAASRRAAFAIDGILVPVRIRLGPETGGVRKLDIGEWGGLKEGALYLDAGSGRVMFESRREGRWGDESGRVNWAERIK